MGYDIFISYRRKDCTGLTSGTNIARTIKQQLEIEGYKNRVFFDYSELSDNEFEDIILKAIAQCKVFVLVLSRDSMMRCINENDWVRREICHAQKCGLKIIPIEPDNLFNGYPTNFPPELDIIKRIQHSTIHMDSSFERDMRAMIETRINTILSPNNCSTSAIKGAVVRVESDLECNVLRYGEHICTIGTGMNTFCLAKGKHKISFVGVESDAERYDCIIDIRDLEYEEYIEVKLLEHYNNRKAAEKRTKKAEEEVRRKAAAEEEEAKRKSEEEARHKAVEKKRKEEDAEMRKLMEEKCLRNGADVSGKGRNGIYKVGDYFDNGTKKGVVFDIWDGGRHGKIVSLSEANKLEWTTSREIKNIGATSNDDGTFNNLLVGLQPILNKRSWHWKTYYPAVEWCKKWGEGWYLPAIDELKMFTLNKSIRDKVNMMLIAKGCYLSEETSKELGIRKDSMHEMGESVVYWSSTEDERNINRAKCVSFLEQGNVESLGKVYLGQVRAIAQF